MSNEFHLSQIIALLERTPAALNALLRGLPALWVDHNEGGNTFSAFDILGHLIVGEKTDWMARAEIILEEGESRLFDKFDRYTQGRESKGKSLEQLLDGFAAARTDNLVALKSLNLTEQDLAKKGTHPSLGTVTLAQLLATWGLHDLTHLHQLARVMAHQQREAVGPWKKFLGVLRCDGHSD
jgi:hypothetical protein